MKFLPEKDIDNLLFDLLKEQVENLSYKLDVALQERNFYKSKYEELQVKTFLSNFTVEEQIKILAEMEK